MLDLIDAFAGTVDGSLMARETPRAQWLLDRGSELGARPLPLPSPRDPRFGPEAGLPVVATRVIGNDEVVVDGVTGALVPFGRPTELGARVADLLADPGWRRRQGAAGRCRYMAGLGRDRMVAETAAVHERLLGASDRPVPAGSRT